jgi:WhiB family redox-sensing transcriptional regulator
MIQIRTPSWLDGALCAQTDPHMFHPEHKGSSPRDAKTVCGRCDVRDECLTWILAFELSQGVTETGVWGGLTEKERRALRSGERVCLEATCNEPTASKYHRYCQPHSAATRKAARRTAA